MPALWQGTPVAYRAVLLAAALLVLGMIFEQLVTLLVAVLITVLIAIPLEAAATWLQRYGVPRPVGALLALVGGLGVLGGLLALVIPPLVEQVDEFVDDVPAIVDSLRQRIGSAIGVEPNVVGERVQEFLRDVGGDPGELVGMAARVGLSLLSIIGATILILITAYYMAVRPAPLVEGVLVLFGPRRRSWAIRVMQRLRESWVGWMQGVLADMAVTGVLTFAGLSLIGLEFAFLFAILSALLVVVPYFGAIAGAIPPVLFALADSPTKALLALGVYVLVQQVEGNVIIPLIMSNRVHIHPAMIAIGVVVVGQLFGFLGLFVAVPIIAAIMILVDEVWVTPRHPEGEPPDHPPLDRSGDSDPAPLPAPESTA